MRNEGWLVVRDGDDIWSRAFGRNISSTVAYVGSQSSSSCLGVKRGDELSMWDVLPSWSARLYDRSEDVLKGGALVKECPCRKHYGCQAKNSAQQ